MSTIDIHQWEAGEGSCPSRFTINTGDACEVYPLQRLMTSCITEVCSTYLSAALHRRRQQPHCIWIWAFKTGSKGVHIHAHMHMCCVRSRIPLGYSQPGPLLIKERTKQLHVIKYKWW